MNKFLIVLGAIFLGVIIVFVASLILAWPVMLLWNWLMPVIFGLIKLTFWQSWGIMMLSGLIIKSSSSVSSSKN
ncbi:hypothetical protein HOD29_05175 [archaeon]|jgi:hypothetical protein|nr:hypothetical protein [archaeon]